MKFTKKLYRLYKKYIPFDSGLVVKLTRAVGNYDRLVIRDTFETIKNKDPELYKDILAYTRIPEDVVAKLLNREIQSFTQEYNERIVKEDHWFYMSSIGYFWGNLSHIDIDLYIDLISKYITDGGAVLEFGGGVGNISYALAKKGYRAEYMELSTIQKDFLRFRAVVHDLDIRIIDVWQNLDRNHYDAILALDVFEHVANADEILKEELVPALKIGGILIDCSVFTVSFKDPMHYGKKYETKLMHAFEISNMELIVEKEDYRIWKKR